jgi:hypothetical protein
LKDLDALVNTLREFWRVTLPDAKVWMGECPYRDELAYLNSPLLLSRKMIRRIYRKAIRLLTKETNSLTVPKFAKTLPTFFIPRKEVIELAQKEGWGVKIFPCIGTNFFPKTRVNYLLERNS